MTAEVQYDGEVGDGYRMLVEQGGMDKSTVVANHAMAFIINHTSLSFVHVLDLGCGSLDETGLLAAYAQKITGVDRSREQIAHAQKRGLPEHIRLIVGDMREITELLDSDKVDLVIAFLSLHYLTYAELCQFFKDLFARMCPGSRLVATINNPRQPLGGTVELGAISYVAAEYMNLVNEQEVRDVPVSVDLYDSSGKCIATLEGVFHHSEMLWRSALEDAGFQEIAFLGAYDSLIVLTAQKGELT